MAIPDHMVTNFRTLAEAFKADKVALVECTDAKTGQVVYVLSCVTFDGETYGMTPFGEMCRMDNPYEAYDPPTVPKN